MRNSVLGFGLCLWLFCICISCCIVDSEARGGRGRGGGSFGGLFGGWRKYKKPSSSGSGRRVLSGSPMHTAMTSAGSSATMSQKVSTMSKQSSKASYPKQALGKHQAPLPPPPPYTPHAAHGFGQAYQPTAGTYYPNTAALPAGAVYYAQPPMRNSGNGDFLMGMLTGHMLNNMLYSPRRHVTQVYQRNEPGNGNGPQQLNADGPQVIVIENGQQQNETDDASQADRNVPLYWPMASDPLLAPLNATLLPSEVAPSGNEVIFQRPALNSHLPNILAPSTVDVTATATPTATVTPTTTRATPAAAQSGIVCFPIVLNETNPEQPDLYMEVEKIICFPKPLQHNNCLMRTYDEPDPTDPTKTIAVQREDCLLFGSTHSTTTTEPPIVAGDIGSGAENSDEILEPKGAVFVVTLPLQENL